MTVSVVVSSTAAAGPSCNLNFYGENQEEASNATEPHHDFHLYGSPVDLDHLFYKLQGLLYSVSLQMGGRSQFFIIFIRTSRVIGTPQKTVDNNTGCLLGRSFSRGSTHTTGTPGTLAKSAQRQRIPNSCCVLETPGDLKKQTKKHDVWLPLPGILI